ncbi:MAG: PD-(D/E)XK nuclease family protein, partial [Alphaproteobacteria bacterium]|nr:PD-(D/E)XK nuclease family protein [Alphaproteobacteria bacterium]
MRETIIIHSRLAWSAARAQAAIERRHGLQALSVEHLAARLAGGFLRPIDSDALKAAIAEAKTADLGELNGIKGLPGFSRAAAQTLSKAWLANLDLPRLAADAAPMARSRLDALGRLEAEALRRLPPSMRRPGDLVAAALSRLCYARTLFGRISVNGRTEMSPVWRPFLAALSEVVEVRWI